MDSVSPIFIYLFIFCFICLELSYRRHQLHLCVSRSHVWKTHFFHLPISLHYVAQISITPLSYSSTLQPSKSTPFLLTTYSRHPVWTDRGVIPCTCKSNRILSQLGIWVCFKWNEKLSVLLLPHKICFYLIWSSIHRFNYTSSF